ncbi:MAG: hypothetical protein ACP6IQ_06635 [Candidatus Njordarchaeia archaeon]|nr:hypothetical protein [Candidatus Korarchaeota archaeon]
MSVVCSYCGKKILKKEAILVEIGNIKQYFCSEEHLISFYLFSKKEKKGERV